MASNAPVDDEWRETSAPIITEDKRRKTFRLDLRYARRKGDKSTRKCSIDFTTREAADQAAHSWRLIWEKEHSDTLPMPDHPLPNSDSAAPGSSSPRLPQGISGNNMHKLSCAPERAYKKHRLAHPERRHEERVKRTRREENMRKKLDHRRYYLVKRVGELTMRVKETKALIDRLRAAMLRDVSVLLQDASGEEGVAATGDSENAASPAPVRNAPVPDAQRVRLYSQAMATMEVFQQQCDRDAIQLAEYESALRVLTAPGADSIANLAATANEVYKHMNAASTMRLHNSLLLIAARVVESGHLDYQPTTILQWAREFRTLDGHFKCDGRGFYER